MGNESEVETMSDGQRERRGGSNGKNAAACMNSTYLTYRRWEKHEFNLPTNATP
jgi:hypothetical protein